MNKVKFNRLYKLDKNKLAEEFKNRIKKKF